MLLVIVGLLLYGRNLPEAGRSLGMMAAKFRRGWQEFKDQLDREGDLREVTHTMRDAAQELKRVAAVPLAGANPAREFQQLRQAVLAEPAAASEDAASAVPDTAEPALCPHDQSAPMSGIGGDSAPAAPLHPAAEGSPASESAAGNAPPSHGLPNTQPRHG